MANRLFPLVVWAAVCLHSFALCKGDEKGIEFFETHIRPVLVEHCYPCHSAESAEVKGGLRLDFRGGWVEGGTSGPAILPGQPEASLLFDVISTEDTDRRMPPDKALSKETIANFQRWISMGAPDPRSTAQKQTGHPSDPIAGRDHWAFLPLSESPVPHCSDSHWANTPIDAFIYERLRQAGLEPSQPAIDEDLLRRLSFQLTGLPPDPEMLKRFRDDSSPDRLERLVDRLLDSPRFGERFGRHWLDVARYADSNGLDENFLFREAWRYRNWVIAAVNADLPLDRFILEQIAGDLLPYQDVEQRDRQRIAAGFMVIGPKVLLGNEANRQRMEIADEQLETLGRGLLGQTLGCARCHDHKFDPIPTADYYALAGILTSTNVMEQRYMLGEQRVMEQLVGLGADGEALDAEYERYWRERPALKTKLDHAKAFLDALKKPDPSAVEKLLKEHPDAIAELAKAADCAVDAKLAAQQELVSKLESTMAKPPAIPPRAMVPNDRENPTDEFIRVAGQFERAGKQIPRGYLTVLKHESFHVYTVPTRESGRIQLAEWLTDPHYGAGRLVARVVANRVWHNLMGRGIVRTVDNFGRTGETPSNPELLDYLARRLIESGWSMKALVREIVTSRTFAQRSHSRPECFTVDPENRLWWRSMRRRLDPESLRDAILLVAGQLDLAPMESTVSYLGDQATSVGDNKNRRRTNFPSRSVYLPVIRNDLPELFEVFDFANPHVSTGARPETMVAPQSLFLMNDPMVLEASEAFARRLFIDLPATNESTSSRTLRVQRIYEACFGASPTDKETAAIQAFLDRAVDKLKDAELSSDDKTLRAWAMVCQATFAMSRFQFLE